MIPSFTLSLFLAAGSPCAQQDLAPSACEPPNTTTRETLVNSYTRFGQTHPTIAAFHDGSFVVAWASKRQESASWGVFAQRFDAIGRPLGQETHINQTIQGTQWRPAISASGDHVWISWNAVGQPEAFDDGSEPNLGEVIARRFDTSLKPTSDEIRVNMTTAGEQGEVSLLANPDGGALFAWISETQAGPRAFVRAFDHETKPQADERQIGDPSHHHANIALTRTRDESIVAAWGTTHSDGSRSIALTTLDVHAKPIGKPITASEGDQCIEPVLTPTRDGIAVGWLRLDASAYAADVRTVSLVVADDEDDSTLALGDIVTVARATDRQWLNGLHLAADPSSSGATITAAYNIARKEAIDLPEGDGPVYIKQRSRAFADVYAVDLDASGNTTEPRRLNVSTGATHTLPSDRSATAMVRTPQGQLAAVWSGSVGSPDDSQHDTAGVALTVSVPASIASAANDDYEAPKRTPAIDWDHDRDGITAVTPPVLNTEELEQGDIVLRGTIGENGDPGFTAWTATNLTPPDPDIAVGPTDILGCVNPEVRVFSKTGAQLFSATLIDFFSDSATSNFLFDPVALFDPHSQRFILACNELDQREGIHVGVSQTDSALSTFTKSYYDSTAVGLFPDFPNLGVDADSIYVASDLFSAGGNFIFVYDKQSFLDGTPTPPTPINTIGFPVSMGAVKTFDDDAPAQYFVTAADGEGDNIFLYAITGGASNPVGSGFVGVPTPQFDTPDDAPQQGSSNRVSTVDRRIKNGVYRNGILYCAHGVSQTGPFGLAKVRWYAIDPQGWPLSGNDPVLLETGIIDPGPNVATWFPDISVDAQGNIALVYARSSLIEPVKMGRAFKLASDAPGTVQGVETWITSTTPEEGERWGDYFGLDDDPVAPGRFWGHGEYRTSNWRTWIGSFDIPQDPTACAADIDNDGDADPADFTAWLGCFNDPMSQPFCDRADVNGVGGITPADFTAWLGAFNAGCP